MTSYGFISKIFHWVMALIILALLALGYFMAGMDFSPFKLELYGWHKSFGNLVLFLAVLRLGWRLIAGTPAHLETHQVWERWLSKLIHVALYGALFAMPLSGWIMSSAGDFKNSFFGLFEMPDFVGKDKNLAMRMGQVHLILSYVIVVAVGLHLLGALKHHFIDKDVTLQRMTSKRMGFVGGVLTALFFGGLLVLSVGQIAQNYVSYRIVSQADISQEEKLLDENGVVQDALDQESLGEDLWRVISEESAIRFTATQYGQAFEGSFEQFNARIVFHPNRLDEAHVWVEIDIASIQTGSDDRDGQALDDEWFDVGVYPKAVFEAETFRFVGQNQYEAEGTLIVRGVTQELTLPFTLDIKDGKAHMMADLMLDRSRFGVGQGQWASGEAIGTDIRVSIEVRAVADR